MDAPQDAGLINIVFLLFFLPILVLLWWSIVRIIRRAGYSGWWALVMLVPVVNIVFIWIFAFSKWPRHRSSSNAS